MIYKKKRGNLKPNQSSIVLNLAAVLAARNILHPTAYLIKIGISNNTVTKMLNGKSVQLNFKQLTTICLNLNCTPNDILVARDLTLSEGHALQALKKMEDTKKASITEWLAGKSVEEIEKLMEQ